MTQLCGQVYYCIIPHPFLYGFEQDLRQTVVERDEGNFLLQKHQEAEGELFREAEQVRRRRDGGVGREKGTGQVTVSH